ncbi:Gfo/Idh/MocA family oxidoreductase [Bacteroidota bacterium]
MKIGLIGINTLEKEEHFKLIRQSLHKNLFGLYSHSEDILPLSSNYHVKLFHSTNELFENVDAVYFAGSLKPNYDFALNAIKKSCHIYLEDISTLSFEQVKQLYKVAFEARTKIQLKLTKSFTPEYIEVRDFLKQPKLIEIEKFFSKFLRHEEYFTEILNNLYFADQNIHSGVKKISSLVLPIDNNHFSLVHFRLDYDNGAVVNMKFNNIANENKSKVTFHEKDRIIYIDFVKHFATKHRLTEGQISRREFNIPRQTAFNIEILNFINSCQNLDMQNISESPTELKLIQVTHEIIERILQSSIPV